MYPGKLITFEGPEGAGKTTQLQELVAGLTRAHGDLVVSVREPGGDPIATAVRGLLLAEHQVEMAYGAEVFLFMAARAQVYERVIIPHLEAGRVVLCDRGVDSSVVYQGRARGLSRDLVVELNTIATKGVMPSRTILLDIDAEAGLLRVTERNRMEAEGLAFHQKVREGYLAEAALDPERFRIVDASQTFEAVQAAIVAHVSDLLG